MRGGGIGMPLLLLVPAASQGNCFPDRNCDRIHSVQAATMTPQSWELAWRDMPAKLRTSARHLPLHETVGGVKRKQKGKRAQAACTVFGPTRELRARNRMQLPRRGGDAPLPAANQSDKSLAARRPDRCKSRGTNDAPGAARTFGSLWYVTVHPDDHSSKPSNKDAYHRPRVKPAALCRAIPPPNNHIFLVWRRQHGPEDCAASRPPSSASYCYNILIGKRATAPAHLDRHQHAALHRKQRHGVANGARRGVKKSWFRTKKRCGGEGADHYRRQHQLDFRMAIQTAA